MFTPNNYYHNSTSLIMEITVISAQGLKNPNSFSHRRLRPFVTLTAAGGPHKCHVYSTRVDERGGSESCWGDRFRVPLDPSFFAHRSAIYLQLFTRRLIAGETRLGWCQIPAVDVEFPTPSGSVRYLSYRLRGRDGTRTHGVVNLAVKVEGSPSSDACQTVIGMPVTAVSRGGVTCREQQKI